MIQKQEARSLILNLFEEEALVIGGLVAIHDVEDDLVWRLMKNLDVLLGKTLSRLDDRDPSRSTSASKRTAEPKPHPAIEEFLNKVRRA